MSTTTEQQGSPKGLREPQGAIVPVHSDVAPFSAQDEAAYRVVMKRIIRACFGQTVSPECPAEKLEGYIRQAAKESSKAVADHLHTQAWKRSAKAWEDGNNSGSSAVMAEKEKESIRWATAGERVMALFGIKCDWPGLYPSFEITGRRGSYHDTLSVLKAALEPAKPWELVTA